MKLLRRALAWLVILTTWVGLGIAQTDAHSSVEQALDVWQSREVAHEKVAALGREGVAELLKIAVDDSQHLKIRWHAVTLLPTFHRGNPEVLPALESILTKAKPSTYRCFALHSLSQIGREALPVVVEALDDNSVCMQSTVTHTGTFDVYVSDEAVRILEKLTGRTLEEDQPVWKKPHRNADLWRVWWRENRQKYCDLPITGCA